MSDYHPKKRVPYHLQKHKVKIPPAEPKPCYVYYQGQPMGWDGKQKRLVLWLEPADAELYRFPSRRLATDAIWHTCQQSTSGLTVTALMHQYEIREA